MLEQSLSLGLRGAEKKRRQILEEKKRPTVEGRVLTFGGKILSASLINKNKVIGNGWAWVVLTSSHKPKKLI